MCVGGVVCGVVWCGCVVCACVCGGVLCGDVWWCVVWCGVVWFGLVWCGVVWCGVVRFVQCVLVFAVRASHCVVMGVVVCCGEVVRCSLCGAGHGVWCCVFSEWGSGVGTE